MGGGAEMEGVRRERERVKGGEGEQEWREYEKGERWRNEYEAGG